MSARVNVAILVLLGATCAGPAAWSSDGPALLEPPGPFAVGQTVLDWTDSTRLEPGTVDPDDVRQIPVQIWYPATPGAQGERAPYRPRVDAFHSTWGKESVDFFNSVETTWIKDASLSSDGPFPVFVFSHGWGSRSSSHGTFLSGLASYGYVVVGINHPHLGAVALANGTVTENKDSQFTSQEEANAFYAADVSFVLDRLERLNEADPRSRFSAALDLDRIGAGGHSSGFPAVSGAAVRDHRIKALISFDAGVPRIVRSQGLDVPILLFRGATGSYTDLFFRGEDINPKGTIYDVDFFRVHRGDFFDLVIDGTTHSSVYDEYLFTEDEMERQTSLRNHGLMLRCAHAYLEGASGEDRAAKLDAILVSTAFASLRTIPAPSR